MVVFPAFALPIIKTRNRIFWILDWFCWGTMVRKACKKGDWPKCWTDVCEWEWSLSLYHYCSLSKSGPVLRATTPTEVHDNLWTQTKNTTQWYRSWIDGLRRNHAHKSSFTFPAANVIQTRTHSGRSHLRPIKVTCQRRLACQHVNATLVNLSLRKYIMSRWLDVYGNKNVRTMHIQPNRTLIDSKKIDGNHEMRPLKAAYIE